MIRSHARIGGDKKAASFFSWQDFSEKHELNILTTPKTQIETREHCSNFKDVFL